MTKSSFLAVYGQLSFPVIFLTIFGWFHFKSGPLSEGCLGKFTRIYSVVVLLISEVIIINYLVNYLPSFSIEGLNLLASIGVVVFIFLAIMLPSIVYLSHRRVQNISSLMVNLHNSKQNKSSPGCITYMLLCGLLVLASLAFMMYNHFLYIRRTVISGRLEGQSLLGGKYNTSFLINDKVYFEAITDMFFFTSIYGAILCTSLLASLICLYLGNEFYACSKELSNCVEKKNIESVSTFHDLMETFHNLAGLTESVNNHVNFYIGYNILVSLFIICAMSYALTKTMKDFEIPSNMIPGMMMPVVVMLSNVLLLTIPVSYLHTKVSLRQEYR